MKILNLLSMLLICCCATTNANELSQSQSTKTSGNCELPSPTGVLIDEPPKLFMYWEIPEDEAMWAITKYEDPVLNQFLEAVQQRTNTKAEYLLSYGGHNSALIAKKKAGTLRDANCIEMKLLAIQANRVQPMVDKPTEFLALIFRKNTDDQKKLRVYYYTVNQPGIGRVGDLIDVIESSIADNWTFSASLHNHNFFITDGEPGGRTAPSKPDAHLNKAWAESFRMKEAWITNGFDTVEIPADDFELFESTGPQ